MGRLKLSESMILITIRGADTCCPLNLSLWGETTYCDGRSYVRKNYWTSPTAKRIYEDQEEPTLFHTMFCACKARREDERSSSNITIKSTCGLSCTLLQTRPDSLVFVHGPLPHEHLPQQLQRAPIFAGEVGSRW